MPIWLDMAPRTDIKGPARLQLAAGIQHARYVELPSADPGEPKIALRPTAPLGCRVAQAGRDKALGFQAPERNVDCRTSHRPACPAGNLLKNRHTVALTAKT